MEMTRRKQRVKMKCIKAYRRLLQQYPSINIATITISAAQFTSWKNSWMFNRSLTNFVLFIVQLSQC